MQDERKAESTGTRKVKDERVVIRVTGEKKEEIKKKAQEANLSISAYLLSQLIEPDWAKKISRPLPQRPLGTLHKPPPAPRVKKQMIKEMGTKEAVTMQGVIKELKHVMNQGFDSVLQKYTYSPPKNISMLGEQKRFEILEKERKLHEEMEESSSDSV